MRERDVLITGIGLVSNLGEGPEAHWRALTERAPPRVDAARYAPYPIHPLPEIDWNRQIPKRGDQRQMETWQRLGVYAAGLALDDAGIKADEALCTSMDMVVAAGGGERDEAVDAQILEASATRNDREVLLNEKLMTDLRPTLFLAQLANLLAGNISIVHKVTGSSRTFMGEEGSGVAAIENAVARIRSGQSSHMLVGGSYQCEHSDLILGYELGHYLHQGEWQPLWERENAAGGGLIPGSAGAFLVLESRKHAQKRGAKAYAAIENVASDRIRRSKDDFAKRLTALIEKAAGSNKNFLTVSGASGAHAAAKAERAALTGAGHQAFRAFSDRTGHLKEAQFPFAVALAAIALKNKTALPPLDRAEAEFSHVPDKALATTVGYHLYEGAALLGKAE